jgi:hypothetical protein
MKREIIAVVVVFALGCGVLILQGIRSSRAVPVPAAGATYQELNSFANVKLRAAAARRRPPFREVTSIASPDRITLITGWSLRRGHPFVVHSVEYLFRDSMAQTGIWGVNYSGTNISRWKLKWDL